VKRIEQHIFLVLAILAVGLSVLCYWILEQNAPGATDEQYMTAVQQRVKEEMRVSTDELDQVAEKVRQTPNATFASMSQPTQYPYFVFRRKSGQRGDPKLLFWSDYRFIPDYSRIASVTFPTLINFEQGNYIVSRRRVRSGTDTLDVFSLVNVFRQYRNSNTYLESGYNPALFAIDPEAITNDRTNVYHAIYDNTPVYLFSVVPPKVDVYRNHSTPVNTVILATLGVVFLGLYVLQALARFKRSRRYELGFAWLAVYLVVLRAVMLYFGVPFLFIESDLFNAKFYASSVLVPSLGDLLLNAVVILILAYYWVGHYYHSWSYGKLIHLPAGTKKIISIACVVLSYLAFSICYDELNNIYEKSQFTLDITLNIRFSLLKIVCLIVFVTISSIYFLLNHILASIFLRFNRTVISGILWLLVGTLLSAALFYSIGWPLEPILLLNGLYFLLIYVGRFSRSLYTFRYRTSIYLFLAAFVCAVTTAYVVYKQEIKKQLVHEREFASQLLAENDEFGEFLMSKAQESITTDVDIARSLRKDTLLVRERIQQRIKSVHLDKYFDKYDIDVSSFRADGQPLDISPDASELSKLTARYRRPIYKTQYPGVYFVNEVGNQFIKQYVCFIPIRLANAGTVTASDTIGYVVLDLKLRNERPKSVYPELLVDAKFMQSPDTQEYSYAIFKGQSIKDTTYHRILYSAGSYNYDRKMPPALLADSTLYSTGLIANGYQHVGQLGQDGRIVVVSSAEYPFQNIFSNFSFLYLLLVLTVLIIVIIYAIHYGFSKFSINYSTRIQILLNVAFFLPLLLVIVIILSVISSNYITNQENTYISNTRNIASNFEAYLDEYLQGRRSKASMEEELHKIARDADIDINLFDTEGRLSTSTRPLMYESGHLSKRINPEAYIHVIEEKENQKLLNESLGSKQYRTAYAGIKSYDGRLLGVLSIPYFYARPELDRQIIEVISSALSIFTGLFLFFLILSYFASNVLTKPLKLLTQKIRKTNLDQPNEPLPWRSDDEIGLLIREYNRMLVKLEESKQALAQNEKQSAWREMAKQVAHEIKNPLTPMKLTLQHLQRTFPNVNGADGSPAGPNDPAMRRVIQRTFDSLLDQIDNLSDIATSFSDFAKMPLPKNEVFEVTGVINKAADLYADDERISLLRQIAPGPVMVVGDRQLIGRILTNLIINGIQSVPSDRKPVLSLRLYTNDDDVQIEVHDNGAGIPEAIRKKVFLPNFSTKRGGSGLGLAIAKRGVEHAGGSIWFETTEGVGTSFFLSLPLDSKPANEPANQSVLKK
jgi:two-component system nitrogen regulation sensor histidine kinase NtrY